MPQSNTANSQVKFTVYKRSGYRLGEMRLFVSATRLLQVDRPERVMQDLQQQFTDRCAREGYQPEGKIFVDTQYNFATPGADCTLRAHLKPLVNEDV